MGKFDALQKALGGRLTDDAGHRPQAVGTAHLKGALVINLERLVSDPDQPRKEFDPKELELLGKSLQQAGQQQPIRVRYEAADDRYVIIAGERRYRAAQAVGLQTLEAVVDEKEPTAENVLTAQLVENVLRSDLKPLELAEAYKTLMASLGCDQTGLAKLLNVSQATVSRTLAVTKLPPEKQAEVQAGKVGAVAAVETARKKRKPSKVKAQKAVTWSCDAGSASIKVKHGHTVVDVLEGLLAKARNRRAA